MARSDRRLRKELLVLGVILTGLTLLVGRAGGLSRLEDFFYDERLKLCQFFVPPPTDQIVHLDIDDNALTESAFGRWPWPRSEIADILEEVHRAQPKAVALDILFVDPGQPFIKEEQQLSGPPKYVKVDEDAILAKSLSDLGVAMAPVSLDIVPPQPVSRLEQAIYNLLRLDLELTQDQVKQSILAHKGPAVTDDRQFANAFLAARRRATEIRVAQLWDRLDPSGQALTPAPSAASAPSAATTRSAATAPTPATALASRLTAVPIDQTPDANAALARLEAQITRGLLPHTDLTIASPLLRTLQESFEHVHADRAIRRHSLHIPAGLELFRPPVATAPLAAFSAAAAASAFVNFYNTTDGTVRSIPMFLRYQGRMYPQMGLMMACMILDVDPATMRVTNESITIPAQGKSNGRGGVYAHDIVIPVSTLHTARLSQPVPTLFHIPFEGNRDWAAMYDRAHPQLRKQHLSINVVVDICQTRKKLTASNFRIDSVLALGPLATDPAIRDYIPRVQRGEIGPEDAAIRQKMGQHALAVLKDNLNIDADDLPPDSELPPEDRDFAHAVRSLREFVHVPPGGRSQIMQLAEQLEDQRAFVKSHLKGKGVFIGSIATALDFDSKPTPIGPDVPGVFIHGTIANAILTGHLWRDAPAWVNILVTVLAGLVATAIVAELTPIGAFPATIALVLGYLVVNGILVFDRGGVILDCAGPVVAIVAVWAEGTLVRLVVERVERNRITRRFRSYVDPSLVEYVLEHPEQSVFSGEVREMTVVFTDLAGFTKISEKLGRAVVPLLNELMGLLSAEVRKHHGFVNKFMGDGVMFFFNAPKLNPDHARDALAAVLDIRRMLAEFNRRTAERGLPGLSIRAGVCTGEMIVGDAGSPDRSDYTVLGDNVNLASRLESANKQTGTGTLLVERSLELAGPGFLARPVGRICVVGQTIPVMVHEVLAAADEATEKQKRLAELTREMVGSFLDSRPADCLAAAAEMRSEFGDCKLSDLYIERCRAHLDHPDPGVFECQITLTQK